jgi:hypothetical protein
MLFKEIIVVYSENHTKYTPSQILKIAVTEVNTIHCHRCPQSSAQGDVVVTSSYVHKHNTPGIRWIMHCTQHVCLCLFVKNERKCFRKIKKRFWWTIKYLTNSVEQKPEGSSPHSQQPNTGRYPEPVESNPHPPANLTKIQSDPIGSKYLTTKYLLLYSFPDINILKWMRDIPKFQGSIRKRMVITTAIKTRTLWWLERKSHFSGRSVWNNIRLSAS